MLMFLLLPLLRTATHQDHHRFPVLSEINAVTGVMLTTPSIPLQE